MVGKVSKYAEKVGIVMSVMNPEYEGGDFCAGLTFAYEVKTVALDIAGQLVKDMFNKKNNGAEF